MRRHPTLAVQVRDRLRALIAERGLRPGDRLPSENELIALFEVGRTSIREALKLLEQEGVIQARHGDGRYLTSQPSLDRPLTRLEGVTEMLASRGHTADNTVLDITAAEPDRHQRELLQLPAGEAVVRLERLRRHEDDALLYSVDLFPRSLIARPLDEVDWTGSLFRLLTEHGHNVAYAVAQVRAVTLDETQAERVASPRDGAWLLLVQTHHDSAGRPLLYSEDYHRGTDFSFHLVRRRD
ncbi:GntR family transcriptional regulator [Microbispora triticiradicis]|uniref:GntR family transcriptional regulator n=1 Tax=Microbispora triticiradicis TaxID=2200763 RepID=UPI001AD7525C|nr:GntR family transcriptional regulator [Microbispora triticiradicis]MBO4269663.1 UTRA domain-containing protein [Microbispora triticiradicis]